MGRKSEGLDEIEINVVVDDSLPPEWNSRINTPVAAETDPEHREQDRMSFGGSERASVAKLARLP